MPKKKTEFLACKRLHWRTNLLLCTLSMMPAGVQEIRKIVIGTILATDMSFHFSLTTEFRSHMDFSHKSPEARLLLAKTILHAADLSNPTLPFAINSHISQNVHTEFK